MGRNDLHRRELRNISIIAMYVSYFNLDFSLKI